MKPNSHTIAINTALGIFGPAILVTWLTEIQWRDCLLIAFLAFYIVNHGLDRQLILDNMRMLENISRGVRDNIDSIMRLLGHDANQKEKN